MRKGEVFALPSFGSKSFTVDLFKKIGSTQASIAGIEAFGGAQACASATATHEFSVSACLSMSCRLHCSVSLRYIDSWP